MAKESGDNRCSTWSGDPYTVDSVRLEYKDLPDDRKELIKQLQKRTEQEMWENLRDKSVTLDAGGQTINVQFNRKDVNHIAKDALRTLSGKYFSRESMINIDKILASSKYVPTDHLLYKERSDDRTMFFRYKDSQGRGVYFKVGYRSNPGDGKHYTLHSVSDEPPKLPKK